MDHATQLAAFNQAAMTWAAEPWNSQSGLTMMRLSSEARSPTLRLWAARWLRHHCNVKVIEGEDYASPPPAFVSR